MGASGKSDDSRSRRITKRIVDGLAPREIVWDTEVRGFGVRCQRAAKVYVLKYRFSGRQRWFTIGQHGTPWTPTTARHEAQRLWGEIRAGRDPATDREAGRHKPTVVDLGERYLSEYAAEHKKPLSRKSDERNLRNHILPLLNRMYVADVSRADIDRLKRAVKDGKTATGRKQPRGGSAVTGGPGAANRCLALVSKMFNLAERWGWRPDGSNPCRHVEKYREGKSERFLSWKELARLGDALAQTERDGTESPFVLAAVRLLVFTGARLGEILGLRWEWVDFERALLRLPDAKTGAKVIYLNAPALEALAKLPRLEGNPHVIVGDRSGAHLVNLQKPWRRILARAKLQDVRLHDLRHSFAAVGASGGLSLPMIGKLLGHSHAATTERYAHLSADPVRAANEAIGERIAAAMAGTNSADVVAMPRRKL